MFGRLTTAVDPALYHREERPDGAHWALQWTGTAGFRVVAGGHHFWFDPHLSRHSPWQTIRGPLLPNAERIAADVDRCDAIAVGHSHHDHSIDTPWLAKRHGARVYGSASTLNICRGAGVDPALLTELVPGQGYDDGPFRLTAYRSLHSPFLLGRVPLPGRIETPLRTPAAVHRYRVGEVYGLHLACDVGAVYHVGSANLVEAELEGVRADVVLACTVGRQAVDDFTPRLLRALRPKLVIPCHWDQFWRPIDAPVRQIPGNDLAGFIDEVKAFSADIEVRVLPIRGWSTLA